MAIAPAGFGPFGGDLLVGNFSFSLSQINAFNPTTGAFEGTIPVNVGGNMPGGLWDLTFGNGGSGDPMTLYLTDGLNGEADGLFGALTVPEPSTWAMMLLGFGGLALFAARRRGSPALG
jgi:PEP-CTERM motif